MNKDFGKIITAMVTPFDKNLELDLIKIKTMVKHLEKTGTETLVITGTTGEGPTVTENEKMLLLEEVCKHKSRNTKVIMNVGTNNTKETVERAVKWSGHRIVDGIMVVAPYYNKPSQMGLFKHFETVSNSVNKPIMAYHIPGRTGVTMTAETMIKIAKLPNVTMLKDAEGNLTKLKDVIKNTKDDWSIYSGDDPSIYNYLEIGAKGIVSVASHVIGDSLVALFQAYENDAKDGAKQIQSLIGEVSKQLFPSFAPNPVSVKFVMSILELINEEVRLPLVTLNKKEKNSIMNALNKLKVI